MRSVIYSRSDFCIARQHAGQPGNAVGLVLFNRCKCLYIYLMELSMGLGIVYIPCPQHSATPKST